MTNRCSSLCQFLNWPKDASSCENLVVLLQVNLMNLSLMRFLEVYWWTYSSCWFTKMSLLHIVPPPLHDWRYSYLYVLFVIKCRYWFVCKGKTSAHVEKTFLHKINDSTIKTLSLVNEMEMTSSWKLFLRHISDLIWCIMYIYIYIDCRRLRQIVFSIV